MHSELDETATRRQLGAVVVNWAGSEHTELGGDEVAVVESHLDEGELRALLGAVTSKGRVYQASSKASPTSPAREDVSLPELFMLLIEKRIYGAQIRYEYDGFTWLDTLIASQDGVRLARLKFTA